MPVLTPEKNLLMHKHSFVNCHQLDRRHSLAQRISSMSIAIVFCDGSREPQEYVEACKKYNIPCWTGFYQEMHDAFNAMEEI